MGCPQSTQRIFTLIDSRTFANGAHTLTARVVDGSGGVTASAAAAITIRN
jgi:hypothetical protein